MWEQWNFFKFWIVKQNITTTWIQLLFGNFGSHSKRILAWPIKSMTHTYLSQTEQNRLFLPPANVVCEGYVFTGVCLSTGGAWSWGGSWSRGCLVGGVHGPWGAWSGGARFWGVPGLRGVCSQGGAWSRGCLLLGGGLVETPPDGYCCGRYASYWNAFLFGNSHIICI